MPVTRFNAEVSAADIRALSPEPPTREVEEVINAIRERGDDALREFEKRFGTGVDGPIAVPVASIDAAPGEIDIDLLSALKLAIANVRTVATASISEPPTIKLPQGQTVAYREEPVARAAAYVPGGRGSYPSTAVMCLTTAVAAGVGEVCVLSPARDDGAVDSAVLAVCSMLGVGEVYAIGGAQAVAAAALGTDTIPAVDVIVGPGNSWVQEAKRQLVGKVGIDSVAGPSELVVVADASADAELISLDLLAQAEHGPDSLVVLIANDAELIAEVERRCAPLDGSDAAALALVQVPDLQAGITLADAIAPEHLQLVVSPGMSEELAPLVTNAGCLFVGPNAATAFGDYVTGSNHVLPTGGAARFSGALSVSVFRRRMAEVTIPDTAVEPLAQAGSTIARAEGFTWHALSMEARAQNDAEE
jgi:histidinol dehydrogenase